MRTLSVFLVLIQLWSSQSFSNPQEQKAAAFKQRAFNTSAIAALDTSLYAICMKWSAPIQMSPIARHSQCTEAVKKYTLSIDFEFFQMEGTSVAVVFRNSMLDILSKDKTTGFLKQVVQDLNNIKSAPSPELTLINRLTQWYPKHAERFEILATLFQDTSPLVAQIVWLQAQEEMLNENQRANLDSLMKIAEAWQEEGVRLNHLSEFPSYHSYVPGYLAHLLEQKHVSHWANFSMSYGFNYLYEYLSLRHKHVEKSTYLTKSKYRQEIAVGDVWPAYEAVMKIIAPTKPRYSSSEFQKVFSHPRLHESITKTLAQ